MGDPDPYPRVSELENVIPRSVVTRGNRDLDPRVKYPPFQQVPTSIYCSYFYLNKHPRQNAGKVGIAASSMISCQCSTKGLVMNETEM